ncbi:unnamed protein product [Spirodela intermedia]|uniref:Histone deacetylase complex subunit SAP30 Sin3 binding domain-containing protein n=1 Tax=Spirodela intermedia TaxID=51605 RepID=A0A7I8IZ57_SPIIN|nr:unnamed protein product [Spirodela intermedia]CAA6662992.1 unnamed protein product [Spirodela intermedia]
MRNFYYYSISWSVATVLANGIEVKLQRNALSVIEAPTGHEEDNENDYENMLWNGSDKVDLSKLETTALWRYLRHFNLVGADPNPSKEQLIDAVQRHFMSQQLDELQVIPGFIQAAKRLKTLCN